jgi:hypothetical protein
MRAWFSSGLRRFTLCDLPKSSFRLFRNPAKNSDLQLPDQDALHELWREVLWWWTPKHRSPVHQASEAVHLIDGSREDQDLTRISWLAQSFAGYGFILEKY